MKKGLYELIKLDDIKQRIYEILQIQIMLNAVIIFFDIVAFLLGKNNARCWLYLYSITNIFILIIAVISYHKYKKEKK